MWIIKPNIPEDWNQQLIKIIDGKRDTSEFIESCIRYPFVSTEIVDTMDESMQVIFDKLELKSDMLANTITVYENKEYIIQYCYQQDYWDYHKPGPDVKCYNYFASIINNENENTFGTAVFFQIDKKNNSLMDLPPENIFNILASLYYVKLFQVRNGSLHEISFPNDKKIIEDMMKDKKQHILDTWEFYIDKDAQCDITDLGIELVDINQYNGLIIMKHKAENELNASLIQQYKIQLDNCIKGYYMDINEDYVSNFFMRSK